jgi:hypothetical protein
MLSGKCRERNSPPGEQVMGDLENYQPPEPNWKDRGHAFARAGLGSIPVVGAAATELFQLIVTPSLERRRAEWMNSVAEALLNLEEKEKTRLADLASNEAFIDTVLQASHTALRNSQEEKRKALLNAVLNAALPNPPEESRQQMFIGWIDSLTVWHLRIFLVLADPPKWFKDNNKPVPEYHITSSLSGLITNAFPELHNQRNLYDQIAKDLYSRSLIGNDNLHVALSASGALQQRATGLAKEFFDFITDPARKASA